MLCSLHFKHPGHSCRPPPPRPPHLLGLQAAATASAAGDRPVVAWAQHFEFPGLGESYQLSFDEYQTQLTEDAGAAMLDRAAVAAVPGVQVGRWVWAGRACCCTKAGASHASAVPPWRHLHCGALLVWCSLLRFGCQLDVVGGGGGRAVGVGGCVGGLVFLLLPPPPPPPWQSSPDSPTLSFAWGVEGAFATQEEAKAAFLQALSQVGAAVPTLLAAAAPPRPPLRPSFIPAWRPHRRAV
jgi:hypothetical protein